MLYYEVVKDIEPELEIKVYPVDDYILGPRYGLSYRRTPYQGEQIILIHKDLKGCMKKFVLAHELAHTFDELSHPIIDEIEANFVAALRHPIGFIVTIFKSLTSKKRLKYAYLRFIKGERATSFKE